MRRIAYHIARLAKASGATVSVEAALMMPVLAVIVLAMGDYGIAAYRNTELSAALRSATQFAMANGTDAADLRAVVLASGHLDAAKTTLVFTEFCECGGAVAACGDSCADGSLPARFVTIDAQEAYEPIIQGPDSLSASLTLRVE